MQLRTQRILFRIEALPGGAPIFSRPRISFQFCAEGQIAHAFTPTAEFEALQDITALMSDSSRPGSRSDPTTVDPPVTEAARSSPVDQEIDVFTTAPTMVTVHPSAVRPSRSNQPHISPVSPSPLRDGDRDIRAPLVATSATTAPDPRTREDGQSSEVAHYPLDTAHINNPDASAVRFENLEGHLPDDQLQGLRVFAANHSLGIQRLRLAETNLSNLNGQLHDVREHATSLSRRIGRAMEDNNRFLLESDAQLADGSLSPLIGDTDKTDKEKGDKVVGFER
ncbi:hypothetical protein HWV62_43944 [Athelia sp. TMB]|nr:hypothetical protein HWV62_43944 [Athelia sp. TMB]